MKKMIAKVNLYLKLLKKAKEIGAIGVKKDKDWNGYNVYDPVFLRHVCIGPPYVILVKGDEIRWSTPDEAWESLRERYPYNEDEDGED